MSPVTLAALWAIAIAILVRPIHPPRPSSAQVLARPGRPWAPGLLDLAEAIDLLDVTVTAGLPLVDALAALSAAAEPPFDRSCREAVRGLAVGLRRHDALEVALAPAAELARPTVAALSDALRDGRSLPDTLRRAADDVAAAGRHEQLVAARRLPVRLLFPLVLCILPAFVLLTVVPLLAGTGGAFPS